MALCVGYIALYKKTYVSCWGADADLELPSAYVSLDEGNEESPDDDTDDPSYGAGDGKQFGVKDDESASKEATLRKRGKSQKDKFCTEKKTKTSGNNQDFGVIDLTTVVDKVHGGVDAMVHFLGGPPRRW